MTSAKVAFLSTIAMSASAMAAPQYVIAISVDGAGSSYVQPLLSQLPSINRLYTEGAGTMNARTDYGVAVTLPSHVGMVTGRPMNTYFGGLIAGHAWMSNSDPAVGVTLHSNKGSYVASAFDVAHDNGLTTALWSGKSKFSLTAVQNSFAGRYAPLSFHDSVVPFEGKVASMHLRLPPDAVQDVQVNSSSCVGGCGVSAGPNGSLSQCHKSR